MKVPGIPYVQGRNDYTDNDGRKYGIAVHNTSNDASAEGEASYATRRTDGVSSHFYVDLDSVVQSLDTADKAGHAGSSNGNENAVAVEITGTNSKSRAWWLANVAWERLGYALAAVIKAHWPDGSFQARRASVAEMKANPRVKAFYSHDDMRQAWGGTTHTDPGPNFPWDRLFEAVNTALGGDDDMGDVFCNKGESNNAVRRLQLALHRLDPTLWPEVNGVPQISGVYDAKTVGAVKRLLGGTGENYNPELDVRMALALAKVAVPAGPQGPQGEPGPAGQDGVVPAGTVLIVQSAGQP